MPEGLIGKLKMLPKLAEMGAFFPKHGRRRAVQGGDPSSEGFSLLGPARAAVLAGGRRPLHHAAAGVFQESGYRQAQLRHVPHAGVRRAHHGHALADPQAGRRALSPSASTRARASGWMWPWPSAPTRPPCISAILPLPPDLDEMMIAGFLRGKPVEMVKCETSDLEVPANAEIVLEGYVEPGRAAHRRSLRRSHRLLLARGRVPGLPRRPASRGARNPSTPPPSWGRRPWRISTWARPSSASSCR